MSLHNEAGPSQFDTERRTDNPIYSPSLHDLIQARGNETLTSGLNSVTTEGGLNSNVMTQDNFGFTNALNSKYAPQVMNTQLKMRVFEKSVLKEKKNSQSPNITQRIQKDQLNDIIINPK